MSSLGSNANSDRYSCRSGFRGITLSAFSALNLCWDLLQLFVHEHDFIFKSASCSCPFSQDYRLYWLALWCSQLYSLVHCVCLGLDFNSRWRCKTITLLSLMIIVSRASAPKAASLPFPDLVSLPEKEQQISDQILINCMDYFIHIFACCITFKATVLTILRHLQTINLRRHGGLLSLRACMKLKKFNRRHLCWSLVCKLQLQSYLTMVSCSPDFIPLYGVSAVKLDTTQGDMSIIYAYTHRPSSPKLKVNHIFPSADPYCAALHLVQRW